MSSNLPSNNNLILGLTGEIFKRLLGRPSSGSNKNDSWKDLLPLLLAVAILFAISTAPYKILLRKNIGQNAISMIDILAGTIFFGIWSLIASALALQGGKTSDLNAYERYFMNEYVLWAIAAIFFVIALFVLLKGFKENSRHTFSIKQNWTSDNYRGDSLLFQNHINSVELMLKVWKSIEPMFCFKWSLILLLIHPLLGFPLLFAAVSFWVNENYHVRFKWEKLSDTRPVDSNYTGNANEHFVG